MVFFLHYVLSPTSTPRIMPEPPLVLPNQVIGDIKQNIEATIENGGKIRAQLAEFSGNAPWDTDWEVEAAVEALHVFGSRWTIEILSTLYIAGQEDSISLSLFFQEFLQEHYLTNSNF